MASHYYRVESGTMRHKCWALNADSAIRKSLRFARWRALGVLTRVQRRWEDTTPPFWGPWRYVDTEVAIKTAQKAKQTAAGMRPKRKL